MVGGVRVGGVLVRSAGVLGGVVGVAQGGDHAVFVGRGGFAKVKALAVGVGWVGRACGFDG